VNHLRTILLTFNASFNAVGPDKANDLRVVKCHLSNFNANPAVTNKSYGISSNSPYEPKVKTVLYIGAFVELDDVERHQLQF